MNVTNHASYRYAQRIKGIEDVFEAKQYVAQNREQVYADILKLHEGAEHFWTGRLKDNVTRHYFLNDTTVIVTDTDQNSVVTLWVTDFGFPQAVNKKTLKGLMSEIRKLSTQIEKEGAKVASEIELHETRIDQLDIQIKATQTQLELLKSKRDAQVAEMDGLKRSGDNIRAEIDKIASTVVSSIDFRKDLQEWSKKA